MIVAAARTLKGTRGNVSRADIRVWDYPRDCIDRVTSRLALHYIQDLDPVFAKAHAALRVDGRFVFSVEHPVITSCDSAWGGKGLRQDWLVDNYFATGKRVTNWLGAQVVKYHRTVEDYFSALQRAGFVVQSVRESCPGRRHFLDEATFERRMRIPLFLFMAGQKR